MRLETCLTGTLSREAVPSLGYDPILSTTKHVPPGEAQARDVAAALDVAAVRDVTAAA